MQDGERLIYGGDRMTSTLARSKRSRDEIWPGIATSEEELSADGATVNEPDAAGRKHQETRSAQASPVGADERSLTTLLSELVTADLDPSDLASRDPEFIKAVVPLFEFLRFHYFRTEFIGAKYIPKNGPFIVVGNHSGGPMLPDVWLMLGFWATTFGIERPAYALVHDAALKVPVVKNFLIKLGGLRACPENAEKALEQGGPLLIYPGGDLDCLRSFWDRNKIDFQGRTGFIELAFQHGVPILPIANVGAHEVYFTLFSSQSLAQWTGMDRLTRVKTLPLNIGLPWGMWLSGFIPYLPLPSKIVYKIGKPIPFERDPELAKDKRAVKRVYRRVTRVMQKMMDDLAAKRRFPVIG